MHILWEHVNWQLAVRCEVLLFVSYFQKHISVARMLCKCWVSWSTLTASPVCASPSIDSLYKGESSSSSSLIYTHRESSWAVTRNNAVSKKNIAFLKTSTFGKSRKNHRPESSQDSSSGSFTSSWTTSLNCCSLGFLACEMSRWPWAWGSCQLQVSAPVRISGCLCSVGQQSSCSSCSMWKETST